MKHDILNVILVAGLVMMATAIFALLLALPTMWLWNWLMPALFGLAKINFWSALGINLLCGILFKSTTTVKRD